MFYTSYWFNKKAVLYRPISFLYWAKSIAIWDMLCTEKVKHSGGGLSLYLLVGAVSENSWAPRFPPQAHSIGAGVEFWTLSRYVMNVDISNAATKLKFLKQTYSWRQSSLIWCMTIMYMLKMKIHAKVKLRLPHSRDSEAGGEQRKEALLW